MLLPLRWLLYGTAAAQSTGHPSAKLRRKLRRLAQWSEAIAPPRVDVVAPVQGIQIAAPRVAPARVSIAVSVAPITGIPIGNIPAISVAAPVAGITADFEIAPVTVVAGIDLFDYEIAALMAA
jgi:hypothetical protein